MYVQVWAGASELYRIGAGNDLILLWEMMQSIEAGIFGMRVYKIAYIRLFRAARKTIEL